MHRKSHNLPNADMEQPEEERWPCTPAPYHSAKGLELPDWNAGFKMASPTFSRDTPARTPWRLGPPQVALPPTLCPDTTAPHQVCAVLHSRASHPADIYHSGHVGWRNSTSTLTGWGV